MRRMPPLSGVWRSGKPVSPCRRSAGRRHDPPGGRQIVMHHRRRLLGKGDEHPTAVARIGAMLADGRSRGIQLQLEITETVMIRDLAEAARVMEQLRALGVSFALDDFGIGYSSLVYLQRLPIDCIKIDRFFSEAILTSSRSRAIVRAIIALGHDLNLKIVAEGVGTVEQLRFLRSEGCDMIQGFLMSQPVPARAFAGLLRNSSAVPPGSATQGDGSVLARLSASR